MYTDKWLPKFRDQVQKYPDKKKQLDSKINIILQHPYKSEALKYQLSGLRSRPVGGNFLVIFGILEEHRKSNFQFEFSLEALKDCNDKTILFVSFGPHDDAYKIAKKISGYEITFEP